MFIDDLVTLLTFANLGTPGVSIFWTSSAGLPDNLKSGVNLAGFITIQETGGTAPILMHYSDTTPGYERPSAQIVTRANATPPARALAKAAWNVFAQRRDLTINGTWYVSIDVMQSPFDLGTDEVGRTRFAFNIRAVKRPS